MFKSSKFCFLKLIISKYNVQWLLYAVYLKFQERVPHTKTRKKVRIYVCQQTLSFRGAAQEHIDLNPLDFYLCGHLNTIMYSPPIENKEALHQWIFAPVKPFATAPGPLKWCDSPWSDVSMCALIKAEGILSNWCELWLDKQ
jgi:hypothetical protein